MPPKPRPKIRNRRTTLHINISPILKSQLVTSAEDSGSTLTHEVERRLAASLAPLEVLEAPAPRNGDVPIAVLAFCAIVVVIAAIGLVVTQGPA